MGGGSSTTGGIDGLRATDDAEEAAISLVLKNKAPVIVSRVIDFVIDGVKSARIVFGYCREDMG